jgi:hypothetical protein
MNIAKLLQIYHKSANWPNFSEVFFIITQEEKREAGRWRDGGYSSANPGIGTGQKTRYMFLLLLLLMMMMMIEW